MKALLAAAVAVAALLLFSLDLGTGQITGLNIGTAAALGVAGTICIITMLFFSFAYYYFVCLNIINICCLPLLFFSLSCFRGLD